MSGGTLCPRARCPGRHSARGDILPSDTGEGEPGNEAMAACMQKTLHICNFASRPSVRLPH